MQFVVVVVAIAAPAFVVDAAAAAAAEFDVVISADVAVVAFHLVVLVLFVVAAVASDFEFANGDFTVAWYFLEIFADYFGDLDDIVESAVCRLHLTFPVDLAVFL